MPDFASPASGITGNPFLSLAPPEFNRLEIIADTFQVTDNTEDTDHRGRLNQTITTDYEDPKLTISGSAMINAAADLLVKGSILECKDASGFWSGKFVECKKADVTGAAAGKVAMMDIELVYYPGKNTYWGTNAPTDWDAAIV